MNLEWFGLRETGIVLFGAGLLLIVMLMAIIDFRRMILAFPLLAREVR